MSTLALPTMTVKRSGDAEVIYGMPDAAYHAHPALGSGDVKMLAEAVGRFSWEREHPRAGRTAFDVGHAAHAAILGAGPNVVEYPPQHLTKGGNISTKAATEAWAEEQRAAGLVPVSPAQSDAVHEMRRKVLAHESAGRILAQGAPEVSIFWTDEATGIPCKARIDWLSPRGGADLKTTDKGGASPRGFASTVSRYAYYIQASHYRKGLRAARLNTTFTHIVVETAAPHLVETYELDAAWLAYGDMVRTSALGAYQLADRTGDWDRGYSDGSAVELLPAPGWINRELEEGMY